MGPPNSRRGYKPPRRQPSDSSWAGCRVQLADPKLYLISRTLPVRRIPPSHWKVSETPAGWRFTGQELLQQKPCETQTMGPMFWSRVPEADQIGFHSTKSLHEPKGLLGGACRPRTTELPPFLARQLRRLGSTTVTVLIHRWLNTGILTASSQRRNADFTCSRSLATPLLPVMD